MTYKYKGTFNWHGELHTLFTRAECQNSALNNFFSQLAKILRRSRRSVMIYFVDEKDNWKIIRR